jgi:hypothetical protein
MIMRKSRKTDVIALHFASKLKEMLCTEFFKWFFQTNASTLTHSLRFFLHITVVRACQTHVKMIVSVLCKPVPDTLYVEGSDFKDVLLEACQNLCKADRSCTFYTWNQRTRVIKI